MQNTKNPASEPPGQGSESRQQSNLGSNSSRFGPERQDLSAYAERALSGIIDDFHTESQGSGRNVSLNTAAFRAGQLVGGGMIDRGEVERLLSNAARSTGLSEPEIKSTIRSGINSGTASPRHPEGTQVQQKNNRPLPGRATLDKAARAALTAQQVCRLAGPSRGTDGYSVKKRLPPGTTLEISLTLFMGATGWHPKSKSGLLQGERLLVIPIQQADGTITSVELIDEDGAKAFLPGGQVSPGYWATQPLPNDDGAGRIFLVAEGAATSNSATQAVSGSIGIAALMDSNLPAVTKMLQNRYPAADICILADIKPDGSPNHHAVKSAQESKCRLFKPEFGPNRQPGQTDANDLHCAFGLEELARQLAAAKKVEQTPREAETQTAKRGKALSPGRQHNQGGTTRSHHR